MFRSNEGLFRVPENGGEADPLLEGAPWAFFPQLLPGGSAVLVTNSGGGVSLSSDPFSRQAADQWIGILDVETDSVRLLMPEATDPVYVDTGHILYVHPNGGLWAVPFDLDVLDISGPAVPVLDEVDLRGDRAHYSISTNGTLVYGLGGVSSGGGEQHLVVAELSGAVDTLPIAPRMFGTPRWSPDGRSIAYYSGVPGDAHIYVYSVELGRRRCSLPQRVRTATRSGRRTERDWRSARIGTARRGGTYSSRP